MGDWQPNETLTDLEAAGLGDAVAELIGDYITDTSARLNRMRTALLLDDADAARKEAHSIKGSSLQMNAPEVAAVALNIERAGNGVVLPRDFSALEEGLRATWGGMRRYAVRLRVTAA